MRGFGLVALPAGIALGVAAERAGFGWDDPAHWIPDLAVGWSFLGCGWVARTRRPESPVGWLMLATGATWLLGDFDARLLYVHRGPLIHCILVYPGGRRMSRLESGATVLGYASAIAWPVWQSEPVTMLLAGGLAAVVVGGYGRAVGRERRARLAAVRAALALSAVLAATATARLIYPAGDANELGLLAYEAVLIGIAVGFLVGLLRATWEHPALADLVVDLGEARSGDLRDALAHGLGDPSLEVGYWVPESGTYVDAEGRPLALPEEDSGRAVTSIERDGQRVAALVHDPAVLDDPGLRAAAAAAARLTASNARLQGQIRTRIAELHASRRRLVVAGDAERRRLEMRLREGPERSLVEVAGELSRVRERIPAGSRASEPIAAAERQLALVLSDLEELAAGLHPRILADLGLQGALEAIAGRSPVPVRLSVGAGPRLPREIEAAAYFMCSEALTNVAKHASATRASLAVAHGDGGVTIEVSDDGVGGADQRQGSGLRGLADRIEALGGTLRVESPPQRGTRISAEIPLARDS
jgi:signal transduction histidine kinase